MGPENKQRSRTPQEEELERAGTAAAAGDPEMMIEALHGSFFLDGLINGFQRRWGSVPREDIEDIVSEAVNTAYVAVRNGEKVLNIGGYLFKVARNKIINFHRSRKREMAAFPDAIGFGKPNVDSKFDTESIDEPDPEWDRKRAFALARSLLPLLGHTNQAVMSYILDAVEAGREDLTSPEIAEVLNLSPETVRQAKLRGFRKLARIAKEKGLDQNHINSLEPQNEEGQQPDETSLDESVTP